MLLLPKTVVCSRLLESRTQQTHTQISVNLKCKIHLSYLYFQPKAGIRWGSPKQWFVVASWNPELNGRIDNSSVNLKCKTHLFYAYVQLKVGFFCYPKQLIASLNLKCKMHHFCTVIFSRRLEFAGATEGNGL